MKIFVTGVAGFIGYHLCKRLLEEGYDVVGTDSLNDYYSPELKKARLRQLGIEFPQQIGKKWNNFEFQAIDLIDTKKMSDLFNKHRFDRVVHLAAQAGVRYSLDHPKAYMDSNIQGFFNILECCRAFPPGHLIFASSSSVYGLNAKMPFSEQDHTGHPISLYAATKKSNEMMAHTYSHLFDLACTGLRFFTVYGPWGRPDMAYFSFTKKILSEEPIDVYNHGKLKRDFTYIDDIIEGICSILHRPPTKNAEFDRVNLDPSVSSASYRILNIGNHTPIELMDFIKTLEDSLSKKAILNFLPMQPGDVDATFADVNSIKRISGFTPKITLKEGLLAFTNWYKEFYS